MGAAENGTIVMLGKSGKTYVIDFYAPDAVGGLLTFNANGAAASTSPNTLRIPEDCVITDFSIATGTTAVGAVLNVDNASLLGGTLRYANQLNSLSQRPALRIPLKGGSFLGATNI